MQKKSPVIEPVCVAVFALIALVLLPCLNAFVPEGSALHLSNFNMSLWGKYLTLATLAISVDLLWGFTGLLSVGQALFFALGGYAFGMHLMLKIGKLGQYKADIPDFMVFLGYTKLPAFWVPFNSFWFSLLMVVAVPGVVAYIFGYLAFRSRIKGVYFSILTQALTYAACIMFFQNSLSLGGNNGLTDFKTVLGFDIRQPGTQRGLFVLSGLLLVLTYVFCRWLTGSRFGQVQRAIRDSENRVLFSGYATSNFKLFVFVVASMIAGMAGALYVPQVGIINPSEMHPAKSLEAIVWVAVGGRATLYGPVLGAFFVNALGSWATRAYPDYWLIILGAMFVLVVIFLPGGLVSLPGQLRALYARFFGQRAAMGGLEAVPVGVGVGAIGAIARPATTLELKSKSTTGMSDDRTPDTLGHPRSGRQEDAIDDSSITEADPTAEDTNPDLEQNKYAEPFDEQPQVDERAIGEVEIPAPAGKKG